MAQKYILFPVLIAVLLVVVALCAYFVSTEQLVKYPVPEILPFTPREHKAVVPITYSSITLVTDKPGKEVTDAVGPENLDTVLSLNRIDQKHFQKGQTIVYPSRYDDPFSLSSFPRNVPELVQVPKIILVDQRVQEFAVYENGSLIRFGAVSTGKKSTQTPSMLYHTNWKGRLVTSTVDDEWIMPWYFNLANFDGVSMHQYDLPGYPASHSCVRLSEKDAMWMYDWADQWVLSKDKNTIIKNGTPVLIFGSYDYNATAPWKKLPKDPYAMTLSPQDISEALAPYLPEITSQTP